jgi:hypothetical protein
LMRTQPAARTGGWRSLEVFFTNLTFRVNRLGYVNKVRPWFGRPSQAEINTLNNDR